VPGPEGAPGFFVFARMSGCLFFFCYLQRPRLETAGLLDVGRNRFIAPFRQADRAEL